MNAKQYRPLPACLNHGCGYGKPDQPAAKPPEGFKPDAKMLEMMRRGEAAKEARRPLAALFSAGSVTCEGTTLPYRLFVPETAASSEKKLPMVVFLHGGGERGTDNEAQLLAYDGATVWVRDQLEGDGEACFVLAAQSPETGPGWLEPHLRAVGQAIEELLAKYPIDEDRLYLTGMSMGGGGSWRMNYMYPELFAAVVPMCSACGLDTDGKEIDPEAIAAIASALEKKNLWLFHAADDMVVPVETTRSVVKALEAKGRKRGEDFFYTEYAAEYGYNHGCWDPAYTWTLMRQWLFAQTAAPSIPMGPPPGMDLPFSPEEMKKMMELGAREKEARKVWIDRFAETGECKSPNATVPYRLYVPKTAEKAPLVVLLHGIGGCGNDNLGQILDNDGIIDWVKAIDNGDIPDSYLLAPQCPLPFPNTIWEIPYLELVAQEVERLLATRPIDPARVYVTGLSLGGYGSWNLNRLRPDLFAGVVSCCAACLVGSMFDHYVDEKGIEACAPALVGKPLWMFHAEDDMSVPVETTTHMRDTLKALGKPEDDDFHVTLYPAEMKLNHFCWDKSYQNKDMLQWLFTKTL